MRNKLVLLYIFSSLIAKASVAYTDYIDYQQFRDFAENKGNYRVGNNKIVIPRINGKNNIYMLLPMPDFSSTDSTGVGTLVSPNYITSVAHNGGYKTVTYGYKTGHTYGLIDRNNHPNWNPNNIYEQNDFHTPRLNKVVTDVAPTYIDFSTGTNYNYANDFEIFVRVGSGEQYIYQNGKTTYLSKAYQYLTGGFLLADRYYTEYNDRFLIKFPANNEGPLSTVDKGGDSGSPIWGYHKQQKKWMLLGVLRGSTSTATSFPKFQKEFFKEQVKKDSLDDIVNQDSTTEFIWEGINEGNIEGTGSSNTGIGFITQGDKRWQYNGLKTDYNINRVDSFGGDTQFSKDMNFTKYLTFDGVGGTIRLASSINMGAGMLTFKNDYKVTSDNRDKTWVGAGILVEKDKTVTWEVNGVAGDYLHKIGKGTLIAQGDGDNQGSLNIGEGTVILNQTNGQAFENIDIVSGRGTVQIGNENSAKHLDTSKIYFGFRGGTLDMNGYNLTFGDIRATDKGAKIVNTKDEKVTVTVDSSKFKNKDSIFHGQFGDSEKASNMDIALTNGTEEHKSFGITGGMNIAGDISQAENTSLVLAGEYELPAGKDATTTKENGYFYLNRFNFKNLTMGANSEFQGSVYSNMVGNIETTDNNKIVLGYFEGETKYMFDLGQDTKTQNASLDIIKNDKFKQMTTLYNGNINLKSNSELLVGYTLMAGNIVADRSNIQMVESNLTGDITLNNNSNLLITNTVIKGTINTDDTSSATNISSIAHLKNSLWSVTENSNLSTLKLDNSTIMFGNENSKLKTGTNFYNIETDNLSGNGKVIFRADLSNGTNDKMTITENANNTKLAVVVDNVTGDKGIELGSSINLIDTAQNENVNLVSTSGDKYVDIGSVKGLLDNSGNLKVASRQQLQTNQSEWVSDMTNAALSDFTAKINLIKTQNDLIGDILNEMGSENYRDGISYTGNFSNRAYRSDKFNQFEQNIINNALSYQTKLFNGENWDNYLGISFIYGMGSNKFKGDYKGELESFTESIFTKLAHRNGYYLTATIGGTYLKDKINIDKYETFTGTFGLGTGYEKRFGGLKLSSGLDIATYYITGENYALHDQTSLNTFKRTGVEINDEFLLQIQPNVKLGYNYKYKKLDLGVYGKIGYDYNKYILNSAPELKMKDINVPLQTGLIENGFKFETGVEAEIISFKISLGLVYFTGENNTENLFTNVKFKYLF